MVCPWIPSRLSAAMATQSLPIIATTADPLYSNILAYKKRKKKSSIAGAFSYHLVDTVLHAARVPDY